MIPYLTLVSLFLFSKSAAALSSCIAFDINWNLLAFGFNGKDYNAGTQDTWASGSAADITASGRPPFDGANATCYLSEFGNAIYVMGADKANPSSIYIYDATAKSWSTQAVTTGSFDPSNFVAILDHDTDVFYALSNGELFSLEMDILKHANSTPIAWNDVQKPAFTTDGYQPVMALAQNHIHFLNVPNVPAGSALIFVIHFSFLQSDPQKYGDFPATHGQTASIFLDSGVQQEFVFIPDDGSQTYVINVETNTTQTLAGPTTKDAGAMYFAAPNSIVQLASSGAVSYLPYNPNNTAANSAASWSGVQNLASSASSGSGSSSGGSSSGGSSSTGSPAASSGSPSHGSTTSTSKNGGSTGTNTPSAAVSIHSAALGMASALILGTVALML